MPINNQGSSLRTTTVFGDKVYENEDYLSDQYNARNTKPIDKKQLRSPGTARAFGHYDDNIQADEFEMPQDMEKAIAEDLASKGMPAKTKRKKTTKQTKNDAR